MAKIRHYRLDDVDRIVELITASLPTLPNYKGVKVDEDRIRYLLNNNHKNATFLCTLLVDEKDRPVGGIGGYCTPTMFSFDTIAQDTYFYIEEGHFRTLKNATALIQAYIDWARSRKATIIAASFTGGLRPETMDVLLKRIGFTPVGSLYHWRQKT